MLRGRSMLSRIMLLHIAAMALTALLIPLMLYWLLDADVGSLQQRALRDQTDTLARFLTPGEESAPLSLDLPQGMRDRYSSEYGRYAYAILDNQGKVLFTSQDDGKPIIALDQQPKDVGYFETPRGDRIISGASLRKTVGGQTVWIQVGEHLAHHDVLIDDVVKNFFPKIGWVTVPILLLLLAGDFVIFRRAIEPLVRASDQASHISPTRTDVRLPTDNLPREITPLLVAINQALDRLENGFKKQREFTADAAHELRTPLAILRTRIETLGDRGLAQELHGDVETMSRVVSQLLDAAEVETVTVDPDERADLHQVCSDVAAFVAPIALAQKKSIALTGDEAPVWVAGNAEMINRAVSNLVGNAIRHSPEGGDVEIVVSAAGSVTVLDQGEGVPVANRDKIFERFWHRSPGRSGGAGLGLSIVKRIVETHGGTITVDNRPTGGASFSLAFVPSKQPAGTVGGVLAEPTPA